MTSSVLILDTGGFLIITLLSATTNGAIWKVSANTSLCSCFTVWIIVHLFLLYIIRVFSSKQYFSSISSESKTKACSLPTAGTDASDGYQINLCAAKFCSPWGKPPGSICGLILLKLCTEQVTGHPHRKWPAATWRPETRLKSMMFRWNNRRQHKVTSSRLSPTKATTNESEG